MISYLRKLKRKFIISIIGQYDMQLDDKSDFIDEFPKYEDYINEHVRNVSKVWKTLAKHVDGIGIDFWLQDYDYFRIDWLIKNHDSSKYSKVEFYGYAQKFFPSKDYHGNESAFKYAWNDHQKNNPHHWQYWVMQEDSGPVAIEMPFEYIIEMLCDWGAMSVKFNNIPSEWYSENADNILLSDITTKCVKRWLPKLDEVVEIIKRGELE